MGLFYYLNYFIYRFYERRDADPFIYSLNGSALLVLLNFMTGYYGITYFVLHKEASLNFNAIFILLSLIGANYFLLYRGKKYEQVFKRIRDNDNSAK